MLPNAEAIAAVVFYVILSVVLLFERKYLTIQKIAWPLVFVSMLRTKFGLSLMDGIAAKIPKLIRGAGYVGIVFGFLGMVLIALSLIVGSYDLIVKPEAPAGVGIIQPFAKGIPGTVFVPFFYFIISIFLIATVHEFAHGATARAFGMKVKASGFAFFHFVIPLIPFAFVEPDEHDIRKRPAKEQLAVFAAGPFSNIIFASVVVLLSSFALGPITDSMVSFDGVKITELISDSDGLLPAEAAGIKAGEIIKAIDSEETLTIPALSSALEKKSPGDAITLHTSTGAYPVTLAENPDEKGKAYLGVYLSQEQSIKESFTEKYGAWVPTAVFWLIGLFAWLFILNVGIGLFNLLPLGPIDGGRMLQTALLVYLPKEKAQAAWKHVSLFFLALILLNIVLAIIK
ncbi:TPA: hypothetical protein HA361_03490 [Candidatus Woesearchaeota archaeon]|nr:hypothetical protein [Candidatus Woesearchaeota archaeon]HII68493.1 hypothetical protein [Candidatus Woesearchaeota archaeon]